MKLFYFFLKVNKSNNINPLVNDFDNPKFYQNNSLWQRIKYWLFPQLKELEKLTRQYIEAEIKQRQNIAAKTQAETNLLKIKEVREFNSIINEIFSDDGIPEEAKALKLAKLLKDNHKINSLYDSTQETINQHE